MEILEYETVTKEYTEWVENIMSTAAAALPMPNVTAASATVDRMMYFFDAVIIGLTYSDIVLVRYVEGAHPKNCACNAISAFAFGVPLTVALLEGTEDDVDLHEGFACVSSIVLFMRDHRIAAMPRSRIHAEN
jgi:hypothetical protein